MSNGLTTFSNLNKVAKNLQEKLATKKYILLFAYNGTGKTRLSMEFKDLGKNGDERETLYFNAFTEDMFIWDNDLDNDENRQLRLNMRSRFFRGLEEYDIENKVREKLRRYADFDFQLRKEELSKSDAEKDLHQQSITREQGKHYIHSVSFEREVMENNRSETISDIKISRGEENIFLWCFFLAVAQLAFDAESTDDPYKWVKYVYIDDPISSLDENNLIFVACDLIQLILNDSISQKIIISTHHSLFFNVLSNQLKAELGRAWEKKLTQYFLRLDMEDGSYKLLEEKSDSPFSYHLAILEDLKKAADTDSIRAYHFNMMRSILEKTAAFFGFKQFTDCIKNEPKVQIYARFLNLFSHGKDSFFAYREPDESHKNLFKKILEIYLDTYSFVNLLESPSLPHS